MEPGVSAKKWSHLKAWSMGNSLRIHLLGVSCCSLEIIAASGPRYDWERFGFVLENSPAEADLLIVAGPLTKALAEKARETYEKMRDPRFVISAGSCANTGGMFLEKSDTIVSGIDKILPVDLFVPGCPPRPEAIIHAMLRLQKKIMEFSGRLDA